MLAIYIYIGKSCMDVLCDIICDTDTCYTQSQKYCPHFVAEMKPKVTLHMSRKWGKCPGNLDTSTGPGYENHLKRLGMCKTMFT